ncbi:hypothetical protein [Candidatus Nitrotoga sp. M5]|uniref:hypothetical protein n=1 Tax=Candidatus Nitrotoga sp. M5 TaxID=2890409 RepID=UPI001EF529A8|nr:hypothetical protein [Candidatus Nitrotoga sp. M5]CAH1387015.1 conserved hypothetical protein [Candidatus Nitrotoga sp. M5]
MATYPTLPTRPGGDPKPINGIEIDRAEDGTARGRSYHSSEKSRFVLDHPWLTFAQKDALATFYATNKLIPFDYYSITSAATHSCLFSAPPAYEYHASGYWTAKVEMEEV